MFFPLISLWSERFDGTPEDVLFAVNIDPGEGDLAPMPRAVLADRLSGADVLVTSGRAIGGGLADDDDGGSAELWRAALVVLLVVLGVEQALAWRFGGRR